MYEGLTSPELGPRTRRAEFVDPEIESRISRLDTFQIPRTDNSLQLQSASDLGLFQSASDLGLFQAVLVYLNRYQITQDPWIPAWAN
jgi:hypothetical protein